MPPLILVLLSRHALLFKVNKRNWCAHPQVQWEVLVVDEGHRLKNAESKLADILRSYAVKHRILLTGAAWRPHAACSGTYALAGGKRAGAMARTPCMMRAVPPG